MTPPELLLPGVEWTKHEFERACYECSTAGMTHQLRHRGEVFTATFNVYGSGGGVDRKFTSEEAALDYLRSRLRSLRDELLRIDPPEVGWVPVGECGELVSGVYIGRDNDPGTWSAAEEAYYHDGSWASDPDDLLCLGSTPIRIPEPGEG